MSLNTLRLIANAIYPVKRIDRSAISEELLIEATELAKRNKVLLAFYDGLINAGVTIPEYTIKMVEKETLRKKVFEDALVEIAEEAGLKGIEFMIIKSIKPFPYVGDDIDCLLPDRKSFASFIDMLKSLGYRSIGGGPPEETLVKYIKGMNVYMDVHRSLSASYIPYVSVMRVWRRRERCKLDGFEVFIPSVADDILIIAGHSLLKEFRMNLAEFYHVLLSSQRVDWRQLTYLAQTEMMDYALNIFIIIAHQIYQLLYDNECSYFNLERDNISLKVAYKFIKNSFKGEMRMPYHYPLFLPAIAYFNKLKTAITSGRREALNLLVSFIKAPFTSKEGLNILWKYISRKIA